MTVKLTSLELLSFKGGCTGSSESMLVKMPHCWKSHVAARIYFFSAVGNTSCQYSRLYRLLREDERPKEEGIIAEKPTANKSVHDHVNFGSRFCSQFISTSASMSSARAFANWRSPIGKRIATIKVDELTKLGDVYYVDLTIGVNRDDYLDDLCAERRAKKYNEVLILGDIPPSCIEDITVIE